MWIHGNKEAKKLVRKEATTPLMKSESSSKKEIVVKRGSSHGFKDLNFYWVFTMEGDLSHTSITYIIGHYNPLVSTAA